MAAPVGWFRTKIDKMFRGPRTAPEGAWQPAYGIGEFGSVFDIPRGDGFQRNLSGPALERNTIVAAIRNAYGMSLGAAGWDYIRRETDGSITIIENSAISRVLRYPNQYQTACDLIMTILSSLIYYGNAYVWARTRNDRNEITELVPLIPHYKRAVEFEGEIYYDVTHERDFFVRGDIDALVPVRDVAHIKLSTHRDLLMGESPLTDAAFTMGLNSTLTGVSTAFISNMDRPSGIISIQDTLTATQMSELRTKFSEFSRGPNAGQTPILGGGAKWHPMTISAVDAEIIRLYDLSVIDLCRIFRIPVQLLGQSDNGTASSVETLINVWRATGLLYFAETIERSLERLFRLPPREEIRFDLDNIARANRGELIEMLTKAVQGGLYSPNEARAAVGRGAVAFGDEPRLQAQVVPLSMAAVTALQPATSAPAAPGAPGASPAPASDAPPAAKALTDEELDQLTYHALKKAMEQANE